MQQLLCDPCFTSSCLLIQCGTVLLLTCASAGGFTADNPFPSRYSDYSPVASKSPTAHLSFGMPQAMRSSSPLPGTGLPVVGMVDLEQHHRRLEMQELQQAAQLASQQAAERAAEMVLQPQEQQA